MGLLSHLSGTHTHKNTHTNRNYTSESSLPLFSHTSFSIHANTPCQFASSPSLPSPPSEINTSTCAGARLLANCQSDSLLHTHTHTHASMLLPLSGPLLTSPISQAVTLNPTVTTKCRTQTQFCPDPSSKTEQPSLLHSLDSL